MRFDHCPDWGNRGESKLSSIDEKQQNVSGWVKCSTLSKTPGDISASETVERVQALREKYLFADAIQVIEKATAKTSSPFAELLKKALPEIKESLRAQKVAEAQPDYQNCSSDFVFIDGDQD